MDNIRIIMQNPEDSIPGSSTFDDIDDLLAGRGQLPIQNSHPGTSTLDDIDELLHDGDDRSERIHYEREQVVRNARSTQSRRTEVIRSVDTGFASRITSLHNVRGTISQRATVQFLMRRKSQIVILQWEGFSGTLDASGITHVAVVQEICNRPLYTMMFPIMVSLNGIRRMAYAEIQPASYEGHLRFYLNLDGTATGVTFGDTLQIPAQSISWIAA